MKNIDMGNVIDLYMDGYDEGKDDNVVFETQIRKSKKNHSTKARTSARRKKSYYKSKARMDDLKNVGHYTPSTKHIDVVQGMLRKHQYRIESTIEHPCGCSIGNKKRIDVADQKMNEDYRMDKTAV